MNEEPIPLFTSLPPRMKRFDAGDKDISDAYAMACVSSWIDSGFKPVTVNSRMESPCILDAHEDAHEAVEKRLLDRDARGLYGRPFPYLSDMLAEMRRHGPGVIALTNADIMLRLSADCQRTIRGLMPGQCVVCKRMDVDSPKALQGRPYSSGFDFFAFRTEDLAGLETGELALGVPWWDHYLPLWFYLSGKDRVAIGGASVVHLEHEERWDKKMWFSVGAQVLPMLSGQFDRAAAAPRVAPYLTEASRAERVAGLDYLRYLKGQFSESGRRRNAKRGLLRLSRLNVRTLDAWGSDEAAT